MIAPVSSRRTQAITSQPSIRGAVLGGAGVILLSVGIWRIDGVMAALGLAGCCLVAVAWSLGRLNLRDLDVSLDGPASVPTGVIFGAILSLRNQRGFWDAFGIELELELPGKARVGGLARWVAARAATDLELRVAVPIRAYATTHPVRLFSEFPLGLFEFRRVLPLAHSLVVFPRPIVPPGLRAMGVLMDASPVDGASAGEAAGEPRGLRPWQPGDSPRRIDWRTSIRSWARGAGMIVREADPPGFHPRRCVVIFHSYGADGSLIRPDRFEQALSLAAGTLRHLHNLGIPVRLLADFDGWIDHPAATRAQLASCQTVLAKAIRAKGTEAHDLQAAASHAHDDEVVIAFSDMPLSAWRWAMPKLRLPHLTPELPSGKRRHHSHTQR